MKKRCLALLLFTLLLTIALIGCMGASTKQAAETDKEETIVLNDSFKRHFDAFNVEGSIVIYDLAKNTYTYYNQARCAERFVPASTFKIPNSLIALETGVISDENDLIKWDGVISDVLPEWNKDQTLKSAFKYSVVWYYQELARRIGSERMQEYLNKMDYGNKNINGGIDQFWLSAGELRISQNEQIEMLKKLHANTLPFSQRTMDIVKSIMIMEKDSGYTLRAKTGMASNDTHATGWIVGYIEKENNVYFFATHISGSPDNPDFIKSRLAITKASLADLNML